MLWFHKTIFNNGIHMRIHCLVLILLAILFNPTHCLAQQVLAIGDGTKYGCLILDDTYFLARKKNNTYSQVSFAKQITLIKSKIRKLKAASRQTLLSGTRLRYVEARATLDYWRATLQQVKQCKAGTLNTEEITGGQGGGTDGTGGGGIGSGTGGGTTGNGGSGSGGGGGGEGTTASACAIIGAPKADISALIINGEKCGSGESPIVQLRMTFANGYQGSCTGTAVSQTGIVTAAHCIQGGVIRVDIRTGSRQIAASSFAYHPSWSSQNNPLELNDIAVVVASSAIGTPVFGILGSDDLVTGESALIAGYGLTENLAPEGLRAGYMKIQSSTSASIVAIWNGTIGSNSCNGDSGGPIMVKRNDTWYLAGATSNGNAQNCGVTEGQDISRWANINEPSNRAFIKSRLGV